MANSYVYSGPGTRWVVEDATAENTMNIARVNADHLHEALNTIMDSDAADGVLIVPDFAMRVGNTFHMEVEAGTIWTLGWWQSADTRWWLLGNTADVTSFTRADAEFHIPVGPLTDVPAA